MEGAYIQRQIGILYLRYIDFCVETEIKITPGLDSKKRAGFSKRQVTKWIKEIKQKTIPTAD